MSIANYAKKVKNSATSLYGIIIMARPFDGFVIGLAVILGMIIGSKTIPSMSYLTIGFLMGFLLLAGMDTLNDYYDHEVDSISKPWRPLPRGMVPPSIALAVSISEALIGILLSLYLGFLVTLTALFAICLAILYSKYLKSYLFAKNIVVSVSLSMTTIAGAFAVLKTLPISFEFWYIQFLIILVAFIFEIHKDILDIEGDRAFEIRTIPFVLGINWTVYLISGGYIFAWFLALIFLLYLHSDIILFGFLILVAILGLYIIFLLIRNPYKNLETTRRLATLLFAVMIIILVVAVL